MHWLWLVRMADSDGGHHKMWAIDQKVRALTDCPVEIREAKDCKGIPYKYEIYGESEAYKLFIMGLLIQFLAKLLL
jgi:hypothetical protein